MWFQLSIWKNEHRESQKYEVEKGIGRTNEAAGLIIFFPNSALKMLGFHTSRLFGSGRT
jgi:hypothetical protein